MTLQDFIGQTSVVSSILGFITNTTGAWSILLRGPYGYGKTTLAMLVAAIVGFYTYQIPTLGKVDLEDSAHVHVIDEVHMLTHTEALYPDMERRKFIFATNMAATLPEAFISRCYTFRLGDYTQTELAQIVEVNTKSGLGKIIAPRCKGNPRIGVTLSKMVLANMRYNRGATPQRILETLGIDENGLDTIDRKYLNYLQSGTKSARTLSLFLNLDKQELYRRERWLIQRGLIEITTRGRKLTEV